MNKGFKVLVFLVGLVFFVGVLVAAGDIPANLRLYQGFHENGEAPGAIVGSYYLEKISEDSIPSYVEKEKEIEALKRIYKLKRVKELSTLSVVMKAGDADTQKHEVALNGRKLWLTLNTVPDKTDRFRIRITEVNPPGTVLLESEIIVPEEKTAVLGFKDSLEKIYFLAFNRPKKWEHPALKDKNFVEYPRLLNYIEPVYPPEALKQGLDGEVVLMGQTDLEGKVGDMQILKGHPLFVDASRKALSQWKYSIWKIDGVKKPLDFSMVIVFRRGEPSKAAGDEALRRCRALLPSPRESKDLPRILELMTVNAKKPGAEKEQTLAEKLGAKSVEAPILVRRVEPKYPGAALKQKVQGEVILKCTSDLEGNITTVDVVKGPGALARESVEIARLWKYDPFKVDGVPRPVEVLLVLIYNLEKVPADKVKALVDTVLETNKDLMEKEKQKRNNPLPMLMEVLIIEGEKR